MEVEVIEKKKFWKKRTPFEKLFLIIIAILVVFGIVMYVKFEIANYKLIKSQKFKLKVYQDSLDISKQQLQIKTVELEEVNANAKKKAIATNNKLKSDVKKIDNSTISNSERNNVLAKYEGLVKD